MSEADVYVQLTQRFTDMPKSWYAPKILARLLTLEEARMLLELPASPEDLAQKLGVGQKEVKEKMDELSQRGVAVGLVKEGKTRYFFPRTIFPQLHDGSILGFINKEIGPNEMEVLRLWQQFKETELYEDVREWEKMPGPRRRVIPMMGAVEDERVLLPQENERGLIERASLIALAKCTCRPYRALTGQCKVPLEVHLAFYPPEVQYMLDRDAARKVDAREALEVVRVAEEAGGVPTVVTEKSGGVRHLCHCCSDCCVSLRPYIGFGYQVLDKSRYQCVVDIKTCNGCQDCVERCLFGAIGMRSYPPAKKLKAYVDQEKCFGCGSCVIRCLPRAASLKVVRPPEYISLPTA